ncbi:hypothetical protein HC928_12750 [bacterium]|nr:hypothetical protein [bacterium]
MITLAEILDQQQDLDSLCADRTLATNEIFTPNAYYGFDRVVKTYIGLPDDHVLKFVMPHGRLWLPMTLFGRQKSEALCQLFFVIRNIYCKRTNQLQQG